MFDSTPQKLKPMHIQYEILHESLLAQLGRIRPADQQGGAKRHYINESMLAQFVLDEIVIWDGVVDAFKRKMDLALSWGPFELVEVAPLYYGTDNKRRLLCRFAYHGPADEREKFEPYVRESIAQIAKIDRDCASASHTESNEEAS